MNKECVVLISSCDNYSDVWEAFFTLFFRYWSDCPFKIFLISESKTYNDERVSMIHIGEDKKWASNMKMVLKNIETPYLIYFQEDYLLQSKVDTKKILELIEKIKKYNATYIKLYPSPKPGMRLDNDSDLGVIMRGRPYSISLQSAIWNKKAFESLLVDGETGWDMEMLGSKRVEKTNDLLLGTYKKITNYFYATAIKRGIWYYDAVKLCKREGMMIDKEKRRIESYRSYFFRKYKLTSFIQKIRRLIRRGSYL